MRKIIKIRRATAAQAASNNVVLAQYEWGYETDTGLKKVGDGVTAWNDLPYFPNPLNITLTEVQDVLVETTDWTDDTGGGGFWYADISDSNITSASKVDIIPEKAYKSIVDAAEFASEADSSAGSVRIYAENQPTDDFEVTLQIFK
jgi:hypothetical protein